MTDHAALEEALLGLIRSISQDEAALAAMLEREGESLRHAAGNGQREDRVDDILDAAIMRQWLLAHQLQSVQRLFEEFKGLYQKERQELNQLRADYYRNYNDLDDGDDISD